MLPALFGKLLSVIGYAVSSVVGLILYGVCMVMAAGGRVAGQPVYTTSKKRNIVMTVLGGCMPYYVTRWRWASLVVKPCYIEAYPASRPFWRPSWGVGVTWRVIQAISHFGCIADNTRLASLARALLYRGYPGARGQKKFGTFPCAIDWTG